MAYINEFVPEEEERSFLIPGYKRERTVGKWTIDKEKDYILFKYYTDRDNPVDEYFAFVYKVNLCQYSGHQKCDFYAAPDAA